MKQIFISLIIMTFSMSCKMNGSTETEIIGRPKICTMNFYLSGLTINFNLIDASQKTFKLFINNTEIDKNCPANQTTCYISGQLSREIEGNKLSYTIYPNPKAEKVNFKLEIADSNHSITTIERLNEALNWEDQYHNDNCQTTSQSTLEINE